MIVCNQKQVIAAIEAIGAMVSAQKDYLTDLDAKIGDADHGINLNRGFEAVLAKLPAVADQSIGDILKTVGMTLVSTVGGASGPLYGTAFMYAGNQAAGKVELTAHDVATMFQAALDGIIKRGHAEVGDKTMVDTLQPVVAFLQSAVTEDSLPWDEVMRQTVTVAKQGMESTVNLVALKGRASFLKERSLGHPDPGSVSCYLMIETIAAVAGNGG